MKTFVTLTFALAVSALAQEDEILPHKRDVQTISNVIMTTGNSLKELDTAVKAFNGKDFTMLASAVGNVKTALNTGTTQIEATTPITANEAVTLQSSLGPIQQTSKDLIADLNAKKPEIQQASLCQVVQQQTTDLGVSANKLINVTVAKVPENLRPIAGQFTSQFTKSLDDVSLSFAVGNCTNAAGGAGSGITAAAASNGSTTAPGSGGMMPKSSASTQSLSIFGLVLASTASFVLL